MSSSASKKRRADEDYEDDEDFTPESSSRNKKIVHRLLSFPHRSSRGSSSHNKQRKTAETSHKVVFVEEQQQPADGKAYAGPGMGLLQGITRGSIANMVLARVGKLNPSELLGPPPSSSSFLTKTVVTAAGTSDVAHLPVVDETTTTTVVPPEHAPEHTPDPDEEEEEHSVEEDGMITATPVVPPQDVSFYAAVRPQPPPVVPSVKASRLFWVRTGPHTGVRGRLLPLVPAPGFCMLQTEDGGVVTVRNGQVSKTTSTLPNAGPPKRRKLRNKDKKMFVENVKRLIAYVFIIVA
jgi:hypothetical protein